MYALQRSCVYIARCPFPRVLVPRRRAHASAVFSQLTTGQNFLAKAPPGLLTRPWDGSEEQVKVRSTPLVLNLMQALLFRVLADGLALPEILA